MKYGRPSSYWYIVHTYMQFSTVGLHLGVSVVGHKEEPLFGVHLKQF